MTLGATQAYGEPSYWDRRYSQEQGPFDWYQKYSALAPLIDLYLSRSHRVLVVGCGNSAFSEGMVDDGYEDIVNIDISFVVIEAMQKKYSNRPQLKWASCSHYDNLSLPIPTYHNSHTCGNNSRQNSTMMLEEVGRVLKDKGIYILITYGAPSYRLDLLKSSCKWKIKLHIIG
ncbi:hypothetical protein Cgig2_020745 [Carnegiea gigantea]|uniref:Methyltransferase type 11 domain-containing protein n=1 Tax=Carnegiea gigantea TaxID=171969 RepID=A0A9Q1GN94_9CARY|nr:hypothetical protein Cgig2_020745 [Carnegiea gigantea]